MAVGDGESAHFVDPDLSAWKTRKPALSKSPSPTIEVLPSVALDRVRIATKVLAQVACDFFRVLDQSCLCGE